MQKNDPIAEAINRNFTSPNCCDSNLEAANVVDGLYQIANVLRGFAVETLAKRHFLVGKWFMFFATVNCEHCGERRPGEHGEIMGVINNFCLIRLYEDPEVDVVGDQKLIAIHDMTECLFYDSLEDLKRDEGSMSHKRCFELDEIFS